MSMLPSVRELLALSLLLVASSSAEAQVCSTAPSEARNLAASGSASTHLNWLAPSDSGGSTSILYDVLRSSSPASFSGAQCLASGIAVTTYDDTGFSGSGYYLIRSRNACGDRLGAASSGVPRTGVTCPQSDGGSCFNNFDCVTTACCGGFCRNLDTSLDNCGGCGNPCFVANGVPSCTTGVCGIASCNPSYGDCNLNPDDGCEADTVTDASNCGGCGLACPSPPNANPSCAGSICGITCTSGFADCDGSPVNGCECSGSICCPGGCAPPHINGLGQSFSDCAQSGVPGSPATYSVALAGKARAAWPFGGTDSSGTCSGQQAVLRQTGSQCAVWVYTGSLSGRVRLNASCSCPTAGDPTWY